jgi:Leucine-rich repeat (LRR) protein
MKSGFLALATIFIIFHVSTNGSSDLRSAQFAEEMLDIIMPSNALFCWLQVYVYGSGTASPTVLPGDLNLCCLPSSFRDPHEITAGWRGDYTAAQTFNSPQSDGLYDFTANILEIKLISGLEELIVDLNELERLPETLGVKLFNLRKLSVHSNKLTYLPFSISCLVSLRVLDVHMNKLRRLPEDINRLVSLQILNVSCNFDYLSALPDSICGLIELVELDVSYNQIKTLPNFIGGLAKLKRLYLEGNPLVLPPPEIARDGLEVVQNYMRNRASQSLLPRSLSNLGRKLGKWICCTGGSCRNMTCDKSMTWYEYVSEEQGFW